MPPPAEINLRERAKPGNGAPPLRRRRAAPASPSQRWRKALNFLLLFVTVVLVADSLVGEKGLADTMRARKRSEELAAGLERLKDENVRLLGAVERLKSDPGTIESIARKELGLLRPGEVLVILKDAHPSAGTNDRAGRVW